MQEGPAKDLSFRLRIAVYRTNTDYQGYRQQRRPRLIVEYPLSIL